MMPNMDGFTLAEEIRDVDPDIPLFFLSAKTMKEDVIQGYKLGADDYITKPFTGTELLNAVDGRLKKLELLKKELTPGIEGFGQLMEVTTGKNALKELTEDRNINRYKKKQIIYSEGNHPVRLYYILKGKVKTFVTNTDGKELVTDLYSSGDFLGHIALLEGTVYRDTAEALEETELAVIPKEDFDNMINRNSQVAKRIIQILAKNISEKESIMLGLAYDSLRKKVADALLKVKKKYQQKKDEKFSIHISRENLATIAGTATESLIRTLGDFRNEKLIEIKDGQIFITNQRKLENLIN
jgi:CRP-like cAMP-binding protein